MENNLGNKKVFLVNVYVGNIDDNQIDNYIDSFMNRLSVLSSYDDVHLIFLPSRTEPSGDSVIIKIQ